MSDLIQQQIAEAQAAFDAMKAELAPQMAKRDALGMDGKIFKAHAMNTETIRPLQERMRMTAQQISALNEQLKSFAGA